MNTPEIIKICKNIYADYTRMGRKRKKEDLVILATISYMCNNTKIDYEKAKWVWTQYLEKDSLDFPTAIFMAKE